MKNTEESFGRFLLTYTDVQVKDCISQHKYFVPRHECFHACFARFAMHEII